MITIILEDGIHKYEINGNMVQFFELMGNRWVSFEAPECWSEELIRELIEENK